MRDDYQNAINNNFGVQDTQGVKINVDDPRERLEENYTNKDFGWHNGTHSGDIYISMPDETHNRVVSHANDPSNPQHLLPESGFPGTSGFFTNEETAARSFTADGQFDSVNLGHQLQQAPYFDEGKAEAAHLCGQSYNPEYNSHLDCFRVNPEKMQEHYGTTDFYAAMASCKENTAWGEGGGFQGYNPYTNEMINNGSLEYIPENSRTCDINECTDYAERKKQASNEASAVDNHIKECSIHGNPGERLGYNEILQNVSFGATNSHNEASSVSSSNIESFSGGGARAPDEQIAGTKPIEEPRVQSGQPEIAGQKPIQPQAAPEQTEPQIAGTTPDKKQEFDINTAKADAAAANTLSEEANKAVGSGVTAGAGIV